MNMASMASVSQYVPKNKLARNEAKWFYIFILPWIIGFVGLTIYPMLASAVYSFTEYNIVKMQYVGLLNFTNLFQDPLFYTSLGVTAYYTIVAVPLGIVMALIVALLLNQRVPFLSFWRTIYYLPSVISGVAVTLLWRWVMQPQFGIFNYVLSLVGITGPRWFWDDNWVIPAFWIMSIWGIGGSMVIYLAGLQGVPTALYEAAEIDGANAWNRLFNITLPMISPVLLFNLVTNLIGALQIFTQIYVSDNKGGPNYHSLVFVLYLFTNAFRWFRFGYASALAWILFFIIIGLTYLMLRTSRKLVYYEEPGGGGI
jgi:multiple sugar transport system permease protein